MSYDLQEHIESLLKHRAELNFEKQSLKRTYRGLSVKASIGNGNLSCIPWISYLADGQKTINGIYPVLLFYGTHEFQEKLDKNNETRKIILAYGISATNTPAISWGDAINGKKTIEDMFKLWGYKASNTANRKLITKYNNSVVFRTYDWTEKLNYKQMQSDLDDIIDIYNDVVKNQKTADSSHDSHKQVVIQENNKHFQVSTIINYIKDTNLLYSDNLIKRFAYSLLAKPFVILSGLAGSGKTQLALAFAKALVENEEEQMRVVPVGADWTNREPLLGYPNALKQAEYVHPDSGVLQLLINSNDENNANKPFFLILDEMNLSYVERYFADFLSAMESHEAIPLWNEKNGNVKPTINLPKNLFIIGTINVDETTYMFSPKVLDRANVIEFKVEQNDMNKFLDSTPNVDINKICGKASSMAADFVQIARNPVVQSKIANETLKKFFAQLKKVNAEFGYRTATEIGRFISLVIDSMGDDKAVDAAIVQKLLPKLHGSRKKIVPVLKELWTLCGISIDMEEMEILEVPKDAKYPLTADKIVRMYKCAIDNGFTSFAEA